EGKAATLVTAVRAGRQPHDPLGSGGRARTVGPADDRLVRSVRLGVERVDEAVRGECRADGEPEQPSFAVAAAGLRGDGPYGGEHLRGTVLHDADGAAALGIKEAAVGR